MCTTKGVCRCSHPYTGSKCDQCVNGYEISTQFDDGTHKCVKSTDKCSPELCNFKGSCELKTVKGKSVPSCTCKDKYSGLYCNKCKNEKMQYPGCHSPKSSIMDSESMQSKIEAYQNARSSIASKCKNPVPSSFDNFEDLRYNGQARLSGTYSLSQNNDRITIGDFGPDNNRYYSCLTGSAKSNLRVYIEFLEESYINVPLHIKVTETQNGKTNVLGESQTVYLPNLQQKFVRGEVLELDLHLDQSDSSSKQRNIVFEVADVLDQGNGPTGCFEVYIEVSLIPQNQIDFDSQKCSNDHDNPVIDEIFGNTEVLRVKPGFDFSSIADVSTFKFNEKSYVFKDSDPDFFHQKDIELIDSSVQNLDIELWQNFESSSHLLGLILETPLDGNHDNFMHGEATPDCQKNECIYSDKTFNGQYISYVFNSNIASRVRLWFYRLHTLPSSDLHKDCTPYHFSIKSTKNFVETTSKEKVACMSETFPAKITSRRFLHKEQKGAYILDDAYRLDSFTDISFSEDKDAQRHFSTMILEEESLVKIILRKETHVVGYSVVIYKINDNSEDIVYSTATKRDSAMTFIKDTRVSVILPLGQYKIRIHAQMSDVSYMFKTCDTIRVYFGVTPTNSYANLYNGAQTGTVPLLSFALSTNETMSAVLPKKKIGESKTLMNSTLVYRGNSGEIGLFIDVGENLDPAISEEISEITASIYPNIEGVDLKQYRNIVLATSGGTTHLNLPKLSPGVEYRITLEQEPIVSKSSKADIPSKISLNTYLYSTSPKSNVQKAKVEVDGKLISVPVHAYIPACEEPVLDKELLESAFTGVMKTGVQYEELVVLNEAITQTDIAMIELRNMPKEGDLMISVSPYSTEAEGMLDEFMITTISKGKGDDKKVFRTDEFEENMYISLIKPDRKKHNLIAVRVNYAISSNFKNSAGGSP